MPSPTDTDSLVGQTIAGRYDLVDHIRTTDLQDVYLANDRSSEGTQVRVKLLSLPQAADESYESRFTRQAQQEGSK